MLEDSPGEQIMMPHTTGLIAAPHTPIDDDGRLNVAMIPHQAALLKAQGVRGAFICGTTGEGASLTTEERKQVATCWAKACGEALTLIVHVGHNSQAEAVGLAEHAQEIGADAIAACGPTFFKPHAVEDLVTYCVPIAAAAPLCSFYYYHIPAMTGVSLPMVAFLQQGHMRIPTLHGLKYSHPDLMELQQCLRLQEGRFDILFGVDEMLLGALAVGAKGAVGSTYNYAATLYLHMITAYLKGDMKTAQMYSQHAVRLVEVLHEWGGVQAGKALMAMRGVDCGTVRSPLRPLSVHQIDAIREQVQALPFWADLLSSTNTTQR